MFRQGFVVRERAVIRTILCESIDLIRTFIHTNTKDAFYSLITKVHL